jgi:uncharacterized membrane protein YdbT with pleckstrin-like domain
MRLRPHGRALVLPALVLVLAMGAGGFAAARVPAGEQQLAVRALVALGVLLVVLRLSVVPFLGWLGTTLTVTDRRVRTRQGVLRSRTRDVALWRIADVVVERSVGQRMVGSGTLLLDVVPHGSAPPGHGERGSVVVRDVPGVLRVAAGLNDLLDELDPEDDADDLRD